MKKKSFLAYVISTHEEIGREKVMHTMTLAPAIGGEFFENFRAPNAGNFRFGDHIEITMEITNDPS